MVVALQPWSRTHTLTRTTPAGRGEGHAEEVESARNKGPTGAACPTAPHEATSSSRRLVGGARIASAHGMEATVATIHSHTSIARASAPEECVRDSVAEGGEHTHTH